MSLLCCQWPHFYRADIKSPKNQILLYCHFTAQYQIGTLHFHIRRVSSLFPLFIHTYLLLKEVRGSTTHHQPQLFLSRWRYMVCGAGGPLVVVILKVDSSHETFGSKLKQLSSRTVKKNCCGERGLPALSKKFFITVPKNFPTKVFSQKQKVLASLDKVLQLRYYYSFGS